MSIWWIILGVIIVVLLVVAMAACSATGETDDELKRQFDEYVRRLAGKGRDDT